MPIDIDALRGGQRRALAKAITLVESTLDRHRAEAQRVLEAVLPHTGDSIRIGISGFPGVGKSTFIEAFGLHLVERGKRVAVLAVDPSSPLRGGSILGDKTRMEQLSRSEHAFIRPSPSSGAVGGVAQKTRESLLLCEAAGYDVVLIETVGVGQSEYDVAAMVDFFLVLAIPNAGDELQGIKRGIMELVDGLVINKADGENVNPARQARRHYRNAFRLMGQRDFWTPQVLTCSALEGDGLDDVWAMIDDYREQAVANDALQARRARQNVDWFKHLIHELLEQRLAGNPAVRAAMPTLEAQVMAGETTAYLAAHRIMELI